MANPTETAQRIKAKKPRPDFPLFPHATGRWAKKVRGKFAYFGRIADDPKGEAALNLWLDQRDDLLAGRRPRVCHDGLTIRDLCNLFLTTKKHLVDAHELAPRSFADYFSTCGRLCGLLGKRRLVVDLAPEDFEALRSTMAKTWGPVTLSNEITRIRVIFKFAFDSDLLDRPVRYGQFFKRPSKKTVRQHKQAKGARMLESEELRALLAMARQPVKAMILLGLNAGLGNSDLGQLEWRHLDLKGGWLDYPRPKTAVNRKAKLWAETVEAVNDAVAARPEPLDAADEPLVFLTRRRMSWAKGTKANPLSREFANLAKQAGVLRPGVSFYSLRHVFRTVADETHDQPAVDHVMGHADSSMAAAYRERISDERLQAVSDHVRQWLFPRKP